MLSAERLSQSYFEWYKKQISFDNITDNIVQIDLPFLDSFSDEIAIYAIELSNNKIKLTDDGWTLNNLEEHGVNIRRSKTRRKIFKNEIKSYGVAVSDDELSLTTSINNFPEAKHRLLQAILFVNNMFMLSSPNTTNVFLDDLKLFFETNNIRATQSVSFLGNSGLSHKFDFLISGFKDIPTRLIKTLAVSRNDSVFAKSILTDITQTRLIRDGLTKYYVFINDCSKENTKVHINPDIITLFNQNDIIPVKYSERNKFVKELAV
ncbi:DUF1828 domain-containing protein [Limosilactobacillus sp. RRLNB_1_1]|uniref:DUF1828 domain-containing protein n=2 Tax=Limosilactobacillus albertensis TaxID=2759752 RepID=A0A7W3Y962_9LACO|nr:DUF1828 domain-containing protein [Limosilactobacillus albertensis]MBB1070152.1 DUF1828 domain-containing protein [Limosilactobacillus albertensis]